MTIRFSPGDIQAVLIWRGPLFDSGGGATVLGFNTTEPLTDFVGLAQGIYDAAEDALIPGIHEIVTLDRVYVRNAVQSGEAGSGVAGERTGAVAPPNTSVLLSYKGVGIGPRARGRGYWPGMLNDGDVLDNGTIAPGRLDEIETYFEDFFTATDALDLTQVLLQNTEGKTSPFSSNPAVTARQLRNRAATQRRRLRR